MKFIFLSLLINPKFCLNCKYITHDNKCSLFPKKHKDIKRLVNGVYDMNDYYYHCSAVRDDTSMCGPEGKMYVKKT